VAEEEAPAAAEEGLRRVEETEAAEGGVGDSGEPRDSGEEAAAVDDGAAARSVCSDGAFVGVCNDDVEVVGGTEATVAAGCALDSTATAVDGSGCTGTAAAATPLLPSLLLLLLVLVVVVTPASFAACPADKMCACAEWTFAACAAMSIRLTRMKDSSNTVLRARESDKRWIILSV
jgi:hypothetical protein